MDIPYSPDSVPRFIPLAAVWMSSSARNRIQEILCSAACRLLGKQLHANRSDLLLSWSFENLEPRGGHGIVPKMRMKLKGTSPHPIILNPLSLQTDLHKASRSSKLDDEWPGSIEAS